jgi:manganese oxidase
MRILLTTFALVLAATARVQAPAEPLHFVERVAINTNEAAAGRLQNGELTIRLEVREGEWHPDRDADPGVAIYAFGEEGKPLQVPGPLIRVPEGTVIRALIRSKVSQPLYLHGFYDRAAPANEDTVPLRAGGEREVSFRASAPGTYYYWASATSTGSLARPGITSQLSGALVVDPRGGRAIQDRVIVLGVWSDSIVTLLDGTPRLLRFVMNGRSWPNTETYRYSVGDSAHWRVINASSAVHPMHLHGFYYRVNSRGTEQVDTILPSNSAPHMVVTERLTPGRTMTMSWVPERPGNWLFHCHDNPHIAANLPLPGAVVAKRSDDGHTNHAHEFMGGLVMGVDVRAKAGATAPTRPARRRELRLIARVDTGGTPAEPAYGFVLEEGGRSASAMPRLPGPTLVLKRGEPVRIMVVNELPEATAIHWHGIELESYYDGVADFAGSANRIAPAIQPRDSFEVLFTPPRAGTFIYHTHVDEIRQQRAGLSGPLVVVDPARPYDPATDLTLMLSTPRRAVDNGITLVNGSSALAPLELRAGTRYRLRVINIHTFRPSMRVELKRGAEFQTWRAVAKDGADLPAALATVRPSAVQLGNGETYDFEFTPAAPGDLRIEVLAAVGTLLATVPIHVR